MRKQKRTLKVFEQSGYKYKPTPTLILKGDWLAEWGFIPDIVVTVRCENGKLVITPRDEESYIDAFEKHQTVCESEGRRGGY